jgi:hypothetical protein
MCDLLGRIRRLCNPSASVVSLRTAQLLGLRVRIQQASWMPLCFECFVFSGRGLCEGPITRPEESYRVCRV